MTKRILTLVVEVEQPEANWIWKTHIHGESFHGISIISIANNDKIRELDDLKENLNALVEKYPKL